MTIVDTFRKDIKNALSKGVFHIFTASVFSQVILFSVGIVTARLLGPKGLGHIRVMQVVFQFADVTANFGMAAAIAKYVSEFQSEEAKKKVLFQGISFNSFTAFLLSFILFLLSRSDIIIKDDVARYYLQFLCWLLPFTVIISSILCELQGRKQIKRMAAIIIIQQSFSFLAICSLTYFLMLRGYVIARIGYVVITSLVLLLLTRRRIVLGWDKELFRKMFRFGSFGMLATISWTLVLTVDTLCISNILNDAALVGYYGVAIMMTRGLMIIPGAITQTAFPYLSERSDNFSEIWKQLWRVGKRVALIMGFVCVVVFVLAHWIVTLFFGKEYLPSVSALQVLAPGTFVYSLLNVSGNTYVALGRTDVSLYITIMSGIFNVVMNILLIKHLGMIGAAWATVFTYIFTLTMESFWWWNFYNRGRIYS